MASQSIRFERTGAAVVGRIVPSNAADRGAGVIVEGFQAAEPAAARRVVLGLTAVMLLTSGGLGSPLPITADRDAAIKGVS